jgi:nucleoside-diphosphate-sugar epimerase
VGTLAELAGKRVLVTGATGFVGQHILAQGLALGVELHALSRAEQHSDDVRWWQGDLLDADAIKRTLSQVRPDGIVHLAASGVAYGATCNREVTRVNLEGFAVLLDAVRDTGICPHVASAGSGFEYAPQNRPLREDDPIAPSSVYGVSKAAATQLARLYATSFPITVLRLFSLYGPGEQEPRVAPYVIAQTRRGLPVELTPGEQVRDYTYVKDAAEGFWHALASTPTAPAYRVWNLASGVSVTLRSFLEILGQLLHERGLNPDLRFGARPYRPDELMTYAADIGELRTRLAWAPSTSLAAGLSEMVEQHWAHVV